MTSGGSGSGFSWNLISDLRAMLAWQFMVNAFEAGTIIAIVAGLVGYFVVLRRSSFATHALGHTGFSGAAAAVLVGVQPVYGLLLFTIGTGTGMALLGNKASTRDVEIGTVLAFALALGLLFLNLYQGFATEAYSILFGEVLGISTGGVAFTFWTSLLVLGALALIYRPLLFASLDEDVAEAKGLPMVYLNLAFMVLLAVTISIAVQIIGVLLIFALMVTPAAIAVRLTKRVLSAVVVSILVAVTAVWAGLFIAWYENYPVSFFIVGIIFLEYVCIRGIGVLRETPLVQAVDAPEPTAIQTLRNASLTAMVAQGLFLLGTAAWIVALAPDLGNLVDPSAIYAHARLALVLWILAAAAGSASWLWYLSGFRQMSTSSREFTEPAFLSLLGLLGILLGAAGASLLLGSAALAAASNALAPVAELFGVPLLALGVILGLVGLVGQGIGTWRAGRRYRDGALRLGAILRVIPLAGSALTFVGFEKELRRRSGSQRSPPSLNQPR
ncbi:MAG: DUF973 family protein [Thermoplasmata archaeon]|nr:DUF973 family protein [Thermoplasmata archaeon]